MTIEAGSGSIFQINLSDGGVPKRAVRRAQVTQLGLAGDRQENTHVHGGPERALCLFSLEHIQALQQEGHPIFPGAAGENLTLSGLDWSLVTPGARLQLGEQVLVEVTRYTVPCNTIEDAFAGQQYERISQSRHPGWARVYVKVLEEGEIVTGDRVRLSAAPPL
jgi:MOSC domain-containing protein YiiM